jgi:hypothetical protein
MLSSSQITNLTPTYVKNFKSLLTLSSTLSPNTPPWYSTQEKLTNTLWNVYERDAPKHIRLQIIHSGLLELLIPIIKAPQGQFTNHCLEASTAVLNSCMSVASFDEKDNAETLSMGIELGLIELAVRELKFNPLRYHGRLAWYAFSSLTNSAARLHFVNRLLEAEAHLICVDLLRKVGHNFLQDNIMCAILTSCIRTLNAVARHRVDCLRNISDLTELVHGYVPLLNSQQGQDDLIILGFGAAKLLIRIKNKDEISEILVENPIIMEFYPKLIRQLIQVGRKQHYRLYSSFWKLSGLILDLSLIAQCNDGNMVEMLSPMIPLVLEMMVYHHFDDMDVIKHGLVFLFWVSSSSSRQKHPPVEEFENFNKLKEIVKSDVRCYDVNNEYCYWLLLL